MIVSSSNVFDRLAPDYDESFSDRPPAQWLRQRVRDRISRYLRANAQVVDVGCGTGEDALWLASQGHTVLATDISDGMLEQTRRKCQAAPAEVAANISVLPFDASESMKSDALEGVEFDFLLSNFGALNCVADLQQFFVCISDHIKPNGVVALTLMGRFCAWETVGFTIRGDFRRARRRWQGRADFEVSGSKQAVWYHSPSTVRRMASPNFSVIDIHGIGVFVPSSEFFSVCEKYPRLFSALAATESVTGGVWPLNRIGDHYLIILQKQNGSGS